MAELSTLKTIHSHHATPHVSSKAHPTPTKHSVPPVAKQPSPTSHLSVGSHTASAPSKSTASGFSYPTPSSVPKSSGTIIGLSLTVAFLILFIIFLGVFFYMRRRSSRRYSSERAPEVKLQRLGSDASTHPITQPAPTRPARPGRESVVRTWYGRRVPSGWI
jgi:hypothetical protein